MSLPTKEAAALAHQFVTQELDAPAFFEKLAMEGFAPRNAAEAQQLLEMGVRLADMEARGLYKSAAATAAETGNPLLSGILTKLDKYAAAYTPPAARDDMILSAMTKLAGENEIVRNAALIFAHVANGGQLAETTAA
jgi:hypothetical protein